MKLEIDLSNPQDVQQAVSFLQMLSGGTGAVPSHPVPLQTQQALSHPVPAHQAPVAANHAPPAPVYAPAPGAPATGYPSNPAQHAPQTPPQPPQAAGQITQAQFAEAVQNFVNKYKPKAAKELFARFGFKSTSDVPPERYAELYPHFNV